MADKSSFTKEQWTLLLESPMMAGMAITAADPSGLWGASLQTTKSIEALRQVSAVLAAKAPGDAAAFKSWLRQISQGTAEAASEGGGLLGIGGVQVSDAEKATLAEISAALGI
ncbi:MAG TPA: hypothetical protein VF928_02030 [Usitatibacteraceae bacterium]